MKKAILVTMVMAASMTAKAQTFCVVMAEAKPGEYSKLIATKALDESENNQIVYQDGPISYAATHHKNGGLSLTVYNAVEQKVLGAAFSTKTTAVSLMVPELRKSIGCAEIEVGK